MKPSQPFPTRRQRRLSATEIDLEVVRQRALIVGTTFLVRGVEEAEDSLAELALLAETAGADPVDRMLARRDKPDPATYVGRGKLEEFRQRAQDADVDVVIFDDGLSPAQQRNLEKCFGCDVVDRVALILDIFAQHASSQEGMIQVELAQLRYRLPRLRGRGTELSQQGAGIGTRGPGETQLEVDRRRLTRRISKLERDLRSLASTRNTQRKARRRAGLRRVAIVGYTNAGKSTLLNRLTHSEALVRNQLFSTLDPTTHRFRLPGGETILLSDTVGFIRRLPHELVEAFRSTLEEASEVDLLLHVVDATETDPDLRLQAVREVLGEIGASGHAEFLVWNKAELCSPETIGHLEEQYPESVVVSARTGSGIDDLRRVLGERLRALTAMVELFVPPDRGDVLAAAHREGEVVVEVHEPGGCRVRVRLPEASRGRFVAWEVPGRVVEAHSNHDGSRKKNHESR